MYFQEPAKVPEILTVRDLQQFLHLGRSMAYHLVATGKIRCIRIGRSIRIPKNYLLEFVENHQKLCYPISVTARSGLSKESEVKQ